MDISLPVAVVEKVASLLEAVAALPEPQKTAAVQAPVFGEAQKAEAKAIVDTMKSAGLISLDAVEATLTNLCDPTKVMAYTKKAVELLAAKQGKAQTSIGTPEAKTKTAGEKQPSAMDVANARFEQAIGVKP